MTMTDYERGKFDGYRRCQEDAIAACQLKLFAGAPNTIEWGTACNKAIHDLQEAIRKLEPPPPAAT
jgi:hypothetical protein